MSELTQEMWENMQRYLMLESERNGFENECIGYVSLEGDQSITGLTDCREQGANILNKPMRAKKFRRKRCAEKQDLAFAGRLLEASQSAPAVCRTPLNKDGRILGDPAGDSENSNPLMLQRYTRKQKVASQILA
jgi:hypothetical protein